MQTTTLTRTLVVRLLMLCLGIGAAIAVLPPSSQTTSGIGQRQNPTVQETSLEFMVERRF